MRANERSANKTCSNNAELLLMSIMDFIVTIFLCPHVIVVKDDTVCTEVGTIR
jgi:hypothetical protein